MGKEMKKKCIIEERHEEQAKKVERCCYCNKKIGLSSIERITKEVDLVPRNKKQKFIEALHRGATIGEARKEVDPCEDIDLLVWCGVIDQNTESYSFLKKIAVE